MDTFQELLENLVLKNRDKRDKADDGISGPEKRLSKMRETFKEDGEEEVLQKVLQADIQNISGTLEDLNRDAFSAAVELIQEARHIYICGLGAARPLADFLGSSLNLIFDNVRNLSLDGFGEILERLMRIGDEDCLIGIGFPEYSMQTIKAMELANNHSARVISITDSLHSPLNLYSACNLICRSGAASAVDSLTAPLSVLNALITALSLKNQEQLKNNLEKLERLSFEYRIEETGESESCGDEIEIFSRGKEE